MTMTFVQGPQFERLVRGQPNIDIVRLALEFAQDAYPELNPADCLVEIDRLGERTFEEVRRCGPTVREQLTAISRVLYDFEGFHGNQAEYYDPRNSYLNEVLVRRCGIPISLGILYMAVAREAGVTTYGVPTPGHFVLGCQSEEGTTLYVDPFRDGDVLERRACERRVEKALGQPGILNDSYFRPASLLEIAVRVLRNLKAAYAMENQWTAVLPVQHRLALLLPGDRDERRDLGLIYLRTGEPRPALRLLEEYQQHSDADHAAAIEPYLRSARRMMAELN